MRLEHPSDGVVIAARGAAHREEVPLLKRIAQTLAPSNTVPVNSKLRSWSRSVACRWILEGPSILDRVAKFYDIASAVEAALLTPGHETLLNASVCILLVLIEKCVAHIMDRAATFAALEPAAEPWPPLPRSGQRGSDSIAWHRAHLGYRAPAARARTPSPRDPGGGV